MRTLADKEKIAGFMRAFARGASHEVKVYFTGGVTAVLMGWRESTVDVDLSFDPELDELYRSISSIKEKLQINVELAAPSDFIPPLPGWETRSKYIGREGKASYYNYDLYSQALSKIERGHAQDVSDVAAMIASGLVERARLLELFREIEPLLYKYPAIDHKSFSAAVHQFANE